MNTCDICNSEKDVIAGRWFFYCPDHKQNDLDKTYENEIEPALDNGELDNYELLIDLI